MDGLQYIPGFIDEPYEAELLAAIDAQPWLGDLKRRVQHYGYRYDYKNRRVDPSMVLGPLPDCWCCRGRPAMIGAIRSPPARATASGIK